jgi:hypothetical protein
LSWSSAKDAAEIRGAHTYTVLEVDLTDPDGVGPNSGWYTTNKTLYLTDQPGVERQAAPIDPHYYPVVLDWGTLFMRQDVGGGFNATSDIRVTVRNMKIGPQRPGSEVQAGTQTSPEATGDMLRLSELMRYYEWGGSAVRVKQFWYPDGDTNDAAVTEQSDTIFSGVLSGVDTTPTTITLDCVQSTEDIESLVPLREITDPPLTNQGTVLAPVVYGNYTLDDEDKGANSTVWQATTVGHHIGLVPMVPMERDTSDPTEVRMIWCDVKGVNSGWTNQNGFGSTAPDGPSGDTTDRFYRFNKDSNSFTLLPPAPGDGSMEWEDVATGSTQEELTVLINKFIEGATYLPSYQIISSTGLTNPENCIDGDAKTHAVLDLTNASAEVVFKITPSRPLGNIVKGDNYIQGFLVTKGTTISDAATRVDFGLYASGASSGFVGTKAIGQPSTFASWRHAVQSSGGWGTAGSITEANLEVAGGNGNEQPPRGWDWRYIVSASTHELQVKIDMATASGTGGDELHIVAAGLYLFHDLNPYEPTEWFDPQAGRSVGRGGGEARGKRGTLKGGVVEGHRGDVSNLWANPSKASTDDASGTLTGTVRQNIESPPMIAAHLLAKWGKDVSTGDMVLATSTFGSFRDAESDMDEWLDDVTGGSALSWKANMVMAAQTNVGSAINRICQQSPMMVYKDYGGTYNAICYPNGSPAAPLRFDDSAGTAVDFHTNLAHEDGSDYGKPYTLINPRCGLTGLQEVFNAFRVRYRPFAPLGSFDHSVHVDADGYRVWDATADAFVTSSDTLGDAMDVICSASVTRYGKRRELAVDADTIHDHSTATAMLNYLTTRFPYRRVWFEAEAFLESYDLKPGHVIRISDDMNLVMPLPAYGEINWSTENFMVLDVQRRSSPHGPMVWFRAEQLNPA